MVPRLALASGVLLLLLGAAWAAGTLLLRRSLAPLSNLQKPLAQLAAGDKEVEFPSSRHTEIRAIVTALEDTIRALRKRERHLLHLANHDPLTGLYNRHRLIAELEAEIAVCAGGDRRSALFFIDLDQFKYVNDTCGHAAGDELLKLAAQQIRHGVRAEDFVARFGGDEFVVLLKDISRQDAKAVATQVLELMRSVKHVEQDRVFNLQCSIGIAAISGERFSAHELIAQADIACQTAKSHGRNRAEVYSVAEKRSEQMAKDVDWMQRIRTALDNDGFVLHYQPLLHIKSGRGLALRGAAAAQVRRSAREPADVLAGRGPLRAHGRHRPLGARQRGARARRVRRRGPAATALGQLVELRVRGRRPRGVRARTCCESTACPATGWCSRSPSSSRCGSP